MSSDMKDTEWDDLARSLGGPDDIGLNSLEYLQTFYRPTLEVVSQLIKRETDKAHQEGYKKGYINAGIEALNG